MQILKNKFPVGASVQQKKTYGLISKYLKSNKMKKYFLILLSVWAIQTSYSQTEKGKMFIGGQISLSGSSNSRLDTLFGSSSNSVAFTFAPSFGYFIANNVAIGATVMFGTSNSTQNFINQGAGGIPSSKLTDKSTSLNLGFGGFACYYINITDKLKAYFNGGINYTNSTSKYTNIYSNYPGNSSIDQPQINTISLAVTPGLIYFITPKIGIETSFGNMSYSYSSSKDKSLSYPNYNNSSNYGINLNLAAFSFGLNYFF